MRVSFVYGLLAILAMFVIQSEAVQCHYNKVGSEILDNGKFEMNNKNVSYCSGSCITTFTDGLYQGKKYEYEGGGCNTEGKENYLLAASYESGKVSTFQCSTDNCNAKGTGDYDRTMKLQEVVNKVAKKFTGKSKVLKCHNNNGKTEKCEGLCVIQRTHTGTTADSTVTGCNSEFLQKQTNAMKELIGSFGVQTNVIMKDDGKKVITTITAYCSKENCNGKNAHDKEFAEIVEVAVGKSSVLTAVMPVLLVLSAVLNM